MTSWKSVGVVVEGDHINVCGVNPWNHEWKKSEKELVQLPHPSHPHQIHTMEVFEIETAGRYILFAAAELSANVWGFYVPA